MKIDFEGRMWQVDLMKVSMEQGLAIQAYTGLTPLGWEKSLADPEGPAWLKSMRCLYWLMRAQNGEDVPLETVNFAVLELFTAFAAAGDEGAAQEPEDPTRPAGGLAAGPPATPAAAG